MFKINYQKAQKSAKDKSSVNIDYRNIKTRVELENVRSRAVSHLDDIRDVQASRQTWLPAVADQVKIVLMDIVEECNERIDGMEAERKLPDYKLVVQLAFEFLFEYTIAEDEVPF